MPSRRMAMRHGAERPARGSSDGSSARPVARWYLHHCAHGEPIVGTPWSRPIPQNAISPRSFDRRSYSPTGTPPCHTRFLRDTA